MIVQNVAQSGTNKTDVTFTLPKTDGKKALAAIESIKDQVQYENLVLDENIAKISLVGAGMKSHPGVSANFFRALAKAGVNIEMISTSEIRISVVTRAEDATKAVQAIHSAFDLDTDSDAQVHAGTGR
jgi:aspartate kinase